jgi:AcrR family transcriptional regulator
MAEASRRERRKAATRRAIQLAAWRLVVERGLEDVTVQAISEAVDIAPRTFFGYFSSKEEALALHRLWTASRLAQVVADRPEGERPLESLRALARQMSAEITSDRELMQLFINARQRHPHLMQHLLGTDEERIQAVAEALARRIGVDPRVDPYPALAAWVAMAAGQAAAQRWSQAVEPAGGDPDLRPDAFVDEAFDVLERGL